MEIIDKDINHLSVDDDENVSIEIKTPRVGNCRKMFNFHNNF